LIRSNIYTFSSKHFLLPSYLFPCEPLLRLVRRLLRLNARQESIVHRLLLIVLIPQQRASLTRENTRDPAVQVRNTPNSHANALGHVHARPRHALVGCDLGLDLGSVWRRVQTDVDLGVDDVDAEVGGLAESGLEDGLLGGGTGAGLSGLGGHVGLVADAVDQVLAVGLDELDDAGGAGGLCAVVFEVVVVVCGGVLVG
jgi:hypothetical protein